MENVNIKRLNHNEVSDFKSLVEIFKDVFEIRDSIPNNEHLSKLLTNPDFFGVCREGKAKSYWWVDDLRFTQLLHC